MTTEATDSAKSDRPESGSVDRAQYGLAGVLALVGAYTIYDASTLNVGFGDPIGPRVFPYVIGTVTIVLAVMLAVATSRGSQPEAEEGEDIDLSTRPDWLTVLKVLGFIVFAILTVNLLGWAITGAVLFAGCAWALGSRTVLRDIIIGAVLAVSSWYFFYVTLGVPLSPGILDGIL